MLLLDILNNLNTHHGFWKEYSLVGGLIKNYNKIMVGTDHQLRLKILHWHHTTPGGGHSGRHDTLKRVKSIFSWKGLTTDVTTFVKNC